MVAVLGSNQWPLPVAAGRAEFADAVRREVLARATWAGDD